MLRLFVAVNLPEQLKEDLSTHILPIFNHTSIKVVEPRNLHVTIRFIGYVPSDKIKELETALQTISEQEAFQLVLDGCAHFGTRVAYVRIIKGADELIAIHNTVSRCLGVEPEKRFIPHVTIARNKHMPAKQFKLLVEKAAGKQFKASFIAESVELMRSRLMRRGPEYYVVKSYPLKR